MNLPTRLTKNYEQTYNRIVHQTELYLDQYPAIEALVLGVSGGIDSALVAAIAREVCNRRNIKLIGRSITIETNTPGEIARAKAIGEIFCDDFEELDLTSLYHNFHTDFDFDKGPNQSTRERKIANGNIKARLRMIQLYHLAGVHKGLVLSTDNLTELYMGFWTLHGDVGDYGMIQNLWKTEVYGVAKWLCNTASLTPEGEQALYDCVCAIPTDGLGITDSDLDQLGAESYPEVDHIIIDYLNNGQYCMESLDHPVIKRYEATHYKRDNPFSIPRERIVTE